MARFKNVVRVVEKFLALWLWPPFCLLPVCATLFAFGWWLESLKRV